MKKTRAEKIVDAVLIVLGIATAIMLALALGENRLS